MTEDQSEKSSERLADDLLRGARRIGNFLGVTEDAVYYLRRSQKWPIAKMGKELIASKRQLTHHARKKLAAAD
jgi:hypothetical protein